MKVLVVYKKSAYALYSQSSDKDLAEFMQGNTEDVFHMKLRHEAQKISLETVLSELSNANFDYSAIYRADLKKITDCDLVISVGGDGTLLEVSHYVEDTPILSFNSDPESSVGFFSCSNSTNFKQVLNDIDKMPRTKLNRLEILLNQTKLKELALNDILIAHSNPAATTRYRLETAGKSRMYRSSGILASTAAGSTGWIYQEGGQVMHLSSKKIQYFSRGVRGEKPKFADELKIHSFTRQGKLFIDGAHLEYEFSLGSDICLRPGAPLTIIGDLEKKRKEYV